MSATDAGSGRCPHARGGEPKGAPPFIVELVVVPTRGSCAKSVWHRFSALPGNGGISRVEDVRELLRQNATTSFSGHKGTTRVVRRHASVERARAHSDCG